MGCNAIELTATDGAGLLVPRPRQVFSFLDLWARNLEWTVYELDGIGSMISGEGLGEFRERLTPSGVRIAWRDLMESAVFFEDLYDALIIGFSATPPEASQVSPRGLISTADLAVELVDSSAWVIHSKNKKMIARLERRFGSSHVSD
jgi:hypothetical protein